MNKTLLTILIALGAVVVTVTLISTAGDPQETPSASSRDATETYESSLVFVGRVEPVHGIIDIESQVDGTIRELRVQEADSVEKGDILAVIHAPRVEARLRMAKARLAVVEAGSGDEEIAAAKANVQSLEAEVTNAKLEHLRSESLLASSAISAEDHDRRYQRLIALESRLEAARQEYGALRRGPLPEEISAAHEQLRSAETESELRTIRAPVSGQILRIHRHPGNGVSTLYPSPILQMADLKQLQVRIEISETDIAHIQTGMEGSFGPYGSTHKDGTLSLSRINPTFGPRRLFHPDTTRREDIRVIEAICKILESPEGYYPGQRVFVRFSQADRDS